MHLSALPAKPRALASMLGWLSTAPGAPPFDAVHERRNRFVILLVHGLLVAPWVALGALVRQREALARHPALASDLARSELERQGSEARLRLLQAQVAPHFLFNTLANVQALVDAGSPQAKVVLAGPRSRTSGTWWTFSPAQTRNRLLYSR